ncbi:MAG: LysR family transcriptional regulator [Geminicoccaceae bacterium]|nr:LysR family transcriptional regulator [Geminicoccaceae bacterium]
MMDKLASMAVFAKVVEAESFTGAASQLGLSKSAVSKAVSALEDRLGARLLNRTTRRLALTEVGRAFYERCARIVSEAEEAELAVTHLQDSPRGTLRVNAPVSFGVLHLGPALAAFMERYPELNVDIEFTDRYVDLIEEGVDVAVRIAGELQDSSLIARKLTANTMVVAASRGYWDRFGRPARPADLSHHRCITYTYNRNPREWPFVDGDGRRITVRVGGTLQTNNGDISLCAALAGLGVVRLPRFICGPKLASGELEAVLEHAAPPPSSIYALYPHNRHLSVKVRVFVDFLRQRFGEGCDWDRPPSRFHEVRTAAAG